MLRALPRVLRLQRPWTSLGTRDCASHTGREIQVRSLAGPDQGKGAAWADVAGQGPAPRQAGGWPSAGADLKEREQMSAVEVGVFVQRLRGLMSEIASSAVMGLIETTRGLLPGAGGTQRLPRCLGVALAKELIFTGRRLNGVQAHELGLVNHAVAQNEEGDAAYHRALALAQEILPQAPIAVRLGKVAIDLGMEVDIAAGMAIEGMCYAQNIPTQDRLEGMVAFREKRLPKFVGK
uniref:Enoyl Coenzyme A hydratase domain containing 2 n=1 Tax=Nannospalax galili TaxID=1026970 RepID=A0A8C6W8S1_NANGA